MKMAELIAVSPSLPGVLTRMGIPFGFGDETVEEVCRRNGTDPETFLLICSVYSGDGSLPAKERIRKAARQWTMETGETNLRFDILEKSDAGFRYIKGAF